MSTLSEKHPHIRDTRIQFVEDTHTYYIDGSSDGVTSTTTFIHSHFPHFNAGKVLTAMKADKKAEKYPGMTDDEIKDMWAKSGREASLLGTKMHAQIENFYDGKEDGKESKEFGMFRQFHTERIEAMGYEPYRTEWSIFDESILLAGQVDMLYRRPDGTFGLYDWKRVKELKMDNKWEKGYGSCAGLDHCNRMHYSLQLNVYKTILESHYGLKVFEMFLVILHPDNDEYILYRVPDMSVEVGKMMSARKIERVDI